MFCNKTGLWWAIVESELHSESGDLNLATCLAGTGEGNNMWQDGKVAALGRGGSTLQNLSKVITQRNPTCQGNLDDLSLPGLLQAKLQSSPFLLGRDKIQPYSAETSDAVRYFQTRTCVWTQTHAAKGQKMLLTNTGSCQWVISVPLLPAVPQPRSLLGLFQRGQGCSSMWPHPASHRMMLSCITRQSLEHVLALQLQELSHQTRSPEDPKPKKSQATLPSFPSK